MASFVAGQPVSGQGYDAGLVGKLAALNPCWQQVMLRVRDIDASKKFYENHFNMTTFASFHFGKEQGDFSLYFLCTPTPEDLAAMPTPDTPEAVRQVFSSRPGLCFLELTHNHGTEALQGEDALPVVDHAGRRQLHANGNAEPQRGFGHIAFNCADVYAASEKLIADGVPFKKKPDEGRMKGLAFALDPDGYWVEIVRGEQTAAPNLTFNLSQMMIRVKDPVKSVPFYAQLFNMEIVSARTFADFSLYFLATKTPALEQLVANDLETVTKKSFDPCIELTWNHGTETKEGPVYHCGNATTFQGEPAHRGFGHSGFLVDDLDAFCAILDSLGVEFVKKPSDGKMRGIAFAKDPDGYWVEIVQRGLAI